ncbi:MAG: helix-turn-helix domain-containing protein [Xanthobacteraceae bacterium]|jgi:AcrR family transcriptional regulator
MARASRLTRRDEYAQATRQAILDAARKLFAERGYFATKVDDIAALARVAPATVYAVSGGKQGLLNTLIDIWSLDPIVKASLDRVEKLDDPAETLRFVAAVVRQMREEFGDIMRVLLNTAPHDPAVAKSLAAGTARYRAAFQQLVKRLQKLNALREGMDPATALDVLWFYLGYSGLFVLHDDNDWSYDRAEQWLYEECCRALLRHPPKTAPSKK